MKDYELLVHYMGAVFIKIGYMITKPVSILAVPVIAGLSLKSDTSSMLIILIVAIMLDFVTGMIGSYVEFKNGTATKPKVYFIESSKIRKSIVKSVSYLLLIVLVALFEIAFFTVNIPRLSEITLSRSLTGVEITIGICFLIEFWSILENFKRAGVDIIGKVAAVFNKIKSAKDNILLLLKKNKN